MNRTTSSENTKRALPRGPDGQPPSSVQLPVAGEEKIPRRLLNLHQSADYLGVSYWSVRDYCLQGLIPTVQMPALRPREGARPTNSSLRRVLIDRLDLDAFIAERKTR